MSSPKLRSLADELQDEPDLSIGQEVGDALSKAIIEIDRSNKAYSDSLVEALKQTIGAIESRQIVVENQGMLRMEVTVERDKNLLATKYIFQVTSK